MSAKVYDMRTGSLCKCCTICKYWKGLDDFADSKLGKYGRKEVCKDCLDEVQPADIVFTMEDGDEAA